MPTVKYCIHQRYQHGVHPNQTWLGSIWNILKHVSMNKRICIPMPNVNALHTFPYLSCNCPTNCYPAICDLNASDLLVVLFLRTAPILRYVALLYKPSRRLLSRLVDHAIPSPHYMIHSRACIHLAQYQSLIEKSSLWLNQMLPRCLLVCWDSRIDFAMASIPWYAINYDSDHEALHCRAVQGCDTAFRLYGIGLYSLF